MTPEDLDLDLMRYGVRSERFRAAIIHAIAWDRFRSNCVAFVFGIAAALFVVWVSAAP